MYRRPKSLEVLLNIRTAMSEECGHDVATFVEMVRTGIPPADVSKVVTREEGALCEDAVPVEVNEAESIHAAEE